MEEKQATPMETTEATSEEGAKQVSEEKTVDSTSFSNKEEMDKYIQSEVDKKLTQAITKAKENERKKLEKEMLERDGKYKELFEMYQKEQEEKARIEREIQAKKLISEKGLSQFEDILIHLPENELPKAIETLSTSVEGLVSEKINQRLENKPPTASTKALTSKPYAEMNTEEWQAYKKAQGWQH